jgi:hypothetical protein
MRRFAMSEPTEVSDSTPELASPPSLSSASSTEDEQGKKQRSPTVRRGVPLPFPEDYFDPIEEVEYHPPRAKATRTIHVRILPAKRGKPLPYPLDD